MLMLTTQLYSIYDKVSGISARYNWTHKNYTQRKPMVKVGNDNAYPFLIKMYVSRAYSLIIICRDYFQLSWVRQFYDSVVAS